jgi:trimeric autotransporter adhesin
MAIGRISGQMLKANLLRSGVDLAFETNLLVLDVSNNFVGVGTATPSRQLHIAGTGALRLPGGTTGERGTGAAGDVRYNSDNSTIEGYAGGEWKNLASGTSLKDTDGNTGIDAERTADQNEIHFFTEASGDVAHIRDNGTFEINNLAINDLTISSLTTNGNISISPNGTGSVVIGKADINGGAIDGATIGAASAAAGTFTTGIFADVQSGTVKANDGTTAITIANTTGRVTFGENVIVTGDITGDVTGELTGNAATVTNGVYTTDTATVTNTMLAGSIANDKLSNSAVTIGSTSVSLGATETTIAGLTSVSSTGVTATNVQATNIKANDGTAAITIADSTGNVQAQADLAVVGGLTVGGNLQVNGTTTTINSSTLTIEDPMIQLAKNNSGGDANTFDQGLFMNRGSDDNVSFLWDESADEFVVAVTAGENGSTAGNVTIDSYANFKAGNITATNFYGDGSNLTGIDATAIQNGTTNVATAASDDVTITRAGTLHSTFDETGIVLNTGAFIGNVTGNVTGALTGNADTVTNGVYTTDTATVTNTMLSNSAVTIGSTSLSLGATATTIAGLTSVTSTGFTGALTGNADTVTNGVYTTDTATVTNTMLAGSIANDKLSNSAVTIGSTSLSLGATATTIAGLTSVTSTGFTGNVTGIIDGSGNTTAFNLPVGSTEQRPSAATGVIRFNSTTSTYEGSADGSTWQQFALGTGDVSINKATATGDGSSSTFSGFFSQAPAGANNVMVFIDNVYQEPTENYTVSSTNITFGSAPHPGARIFAMEGFDNTAVLTGGVARTLTEAVSFESSATTIMNFNASDYRSAELYVQITDTANGEYSCMKAQVIHDGSTAYIVTYGVLNTSGADTATLTAEYNSGTVNVQAISTGGASTAKVQYSLMAL